MRHRLNKLLVSCLRYLIPDIHQQVFLVPIYCEPLFQVELQMPDWFHVSGIWKLIFDLKLTRMFFGPLNDDSSLRHGALFC